MRSFVQLSKASTVKSLSFLYDTTNRATESPRSDIHRCVQIRTRDLDCDRRVFGQPHANEHRLVLAAFRWSIDVFQIDVYMNDTVIGGT
jgi:hypothetical protein